MPVYWPSGGVRSDEDELWRRKGGSLSTNEASWLASLFVRSNHPAASLLSPELWLFRYRRGEMLEGGLALSLAEALGEVLSVVEWRPTATFEGACCSLAGGLCRSDTLLCAGGRRGCAAWAVAAGPGTVPGRSFMSRGFAAAGAKGGL